MNNNYQNDNDLIMRLPPEAQTLTKAVLRDRGFSLTKDWEDFFTRRVELVPDFSFEPEGWHMAEDALLWNYDLAHDYARLNSNVSSWGTPEVMYAVLDRLVVHRHVHLEYQALALTGGCDSLYALEREFSGQEGPEMVSHLRDLLDAAAVPWSTVTAWMTDQAMHFHWVDPCRLFLWKSHRVADARCFGLGEGGHHA